MIWVFLTFTFLVVNVTFGLLLAYNNKSHSLLLARLLILEIMFLLMAVFLSLCILATYTIWQSIVRSAGRKCGVIINDYIILFYTLTFK